MMRSGLKIQRNQGFTIVELLIVIVIIAILAAITIVAYNGITRQASEVSIKSDLRNGVGQLEIGRQASGVYPYSGAAAGLKASPNNTLNYVLKPYGYCVQGSNPATPNTFTVRSKDGKVQEGVCNATVSTASGSGTAGYLDGSATNARFDCLTYMTADTSGNLYVGTDNNPGHIRKVAPDGAVSTFATLASTSPYCPQPLAVDGLGNVYFTAGSSNYGHRIWRVTPASAVSLFAGSSLGFAEGALTSARFYHPSAIAIDSKGVMYVADNGNKRIRKITQDGVVSTFAGSGVDGHFDANGTSAQFSGPTALAIDKSDIIYVGDENRVRKITPNGDVTTVAGSGAWGYTNGPAMTAEFGDLTSIAVDDVGIIYVVGYGESAVRKITPDGMVSTLAGGSAQYNPGYTEGLDAAAQFSQIYDIEIDSKGDLYVIDSGNRRIRKVVQ